MARVMNILKFQRLRKKLECIKSPWCMWSWSISLWNWAAIVQPSNTRTILLFLLNSFPYNIRVFLFLALSFSFQYEVWWILFSYMNMGFHCFFLFYMKEIWVWFRNWSSWIKRIEIKFLSWVVFCFCNEFIVKKEYKDDEVECGYSMNLFSKKKKKSLYLWILGLLHGFLGEMV